MFLKVIYLIFFAKVFQVLPAILEIGERQRYTSDYCSDIKIHCLCGSPNNTIIETFTVSRRLEINSNSIREECSKIPLPVDVCLSHSCSVLLPPYTSPDLSAYWKMRRSVKIIYDYPFKLFLQPENEFILNDFNLDSVESPEFITNKRRRDLDDIDKDIFKYKSTADNDENSPDFKSGAFPSKCERAIMPLKNTFIGCSIWPEAVVCEFNCTHGYAISEGGKLRTRAKRICREKENDYIPFNSFPVCKPYINCRTILTRPGNMVCKSSTTKPAYCYISCKANAVYDEVPETRFTCYNKTYSTSLPNCATVDKNAIISHHKKRNKMKRVHN